MSYQFQLGQVLSSPGVRAELTQSQLIAMLRQHVTGEGDPTRRDANELAVLNGSRILSTFLIRGKRGQQLKIWVVTNEMQTRTLVMLPRESAYRASDLVEVPGPLLHEKLG